MTVALDTNSLSYLLRDGGRVAARLRATSPQDIALPVIVIHEISYGLRRARRDAQLASFARMVELTTVLDFDLQATEHAAQTSVALESAGTPIGPMDCSSLRAPAVTAACWSRTTRASSDARPTSR